MCVATGADGAAVGRYLGRRLGEVVTVTVGMAEGIMVLGTMVSTTDGRSVGLTDGKTVGDTVGVALGDADGSAVGV